MIAREKNHCSANENHLNDYFAGACDGVHGRATPVCSEICNADSGVLGTLRIELLPKSENDVSKIIKLNNLDMGAAFSFMSDLSANSLKGWTWITVSNSSGGIVTIQVKHVYSATFSKN